MTHPGRNWSVWVKPSKSKTNRDAASRDGSVKYLDPESHIILSNN